jgi:hypothetical protein
MRRGQRTVIKICACGCWELIQPYLNKHTGRVSSYPKYIPGHGTIAKSSRERGVPKGGLPIGTISLHHSTKSLTYRVIKTEFGWEYEHRVVMSSILGRRLEAWEHVHHDNENTVDNSPNNLVLTTKYDHPGIHGARIGWAKAHECCRDCGTTARRHVGRGLCTACYQHSRNKI